MPAEVVDIASQKELIVCGIGATPPQRGSTTVAVGNLSVSDMGAGRRDSRGTFVASSSSGEMQTDTSPIPSPAPMTDPIAADEVAAMPSGGTVGFDLSHHEVYRRRGAFAGWPANFGLWARDEEILSVFAVGRVGPKGDIHELDREHPFKPCQARSLDGGVTWKVEPFRGNVPGGHSLSADEHLEIELKARPQLDRAADLAVLNEPIDFLDPETIVMCARTGLAIDAVSWLYISRSRGRHWEGPFAFTGLGLPIAARTDIVALGQREALFMLTTAKMDGEEGRVFCARTLDGGRNFEFMGFVGEEPAGHRIMPSSVMLRSGTVVTATRCAGPYGRGRIEVFTSSDEGRRWTQISTAVQNTGAGGNPPALTLLSDGRLALAYGCRDAPFGIRLRLSEDGGKSWGEDVVIRADGGTSDIGYPKVVSLAHRGLLVVYYLNDGAGQERYIASSRVHFN